MASLATLFLLLVAPTLIDTGKNSGESSGGRSGEVGVGVTTKLPFTFLPTLPTLAPEDQERVDRVLDALVNETTKAIQEGIEDLKNNSKLNSQQCSCEKKEQTIERDTRGDTAPPIWNRNGSPSTPCPNLKFNKKVQAGTLAEALLHFPDLLASDTEVSDPSALNDPACLTYECQSCVWLILEQFKDQEYITAGEAARTLREMKIDPNKMDARYCTRLTMTQKRKRPPGRDMQMGLEMKRTMARIGKKRRQGPRTARSTPQPRIIKPTATSFPPKPPDGIDFSFGDAPQPQFDKLPAVKVPQSTSAGTTKGKSNLESNRILIDRMKRYLAIRRQNLALRRRNAIGRRRKRQIGQSEDKWPGETWTINCLKRGHHPDPKAGSNQWTSLCSRCWAWRKLPVGYYPQYINELKCDNDNKCLSGYGQCKSNRRSVDVLRNFGNVTNPKWTKMSLETSQCCDCQVQSDSILYGFIYL